MPDIYDRAKIPVEFFEALQNLNLLREMNRLTQAQLYRLFPTLDVLGKIESRYGETITMQVRLATNPCSRLCLSPSYCSLVPFAKQ